MRKGLRLAAITACVGFALPALAETFPLTKDEMIAKFNTQLTADQADTLVGCKTRSNDVGCSFTHIQFAAAVIALKKLNVVNGRFGDKASFAMAVKDGKVATATIIGDRGDPANLFRTISMVASFSQSLGASDDEVKDIIKESGLMRGDDDPSIGTPKVNISRVAAVTCNNGPSSRSTRIGCVFEPRY